MADLKEIYFTKISEIIKDLRARLEDLPDGREMELIRQQINDLELIAKDWLA